MTSPLPSAEERADRILAEKLRLLYRGNFAVPVNIVIACTIAFLLRHSFPQPLLIAWLAATALVAGLRILLHRRFLRATASGRCNACWAHYFCIGSFASGLLWGGLALGLPASGDANQFIFLTLVAAGMTAGALTTIAAYLPAYLAYAGAFIVPLAVVSLMHPDHYIAATGGLMLLYLLVIGLAARNLSQAVSRTIEIRVDNEVLRNSLKQAHIERDEARTEKWSTLAQLSHELRTPLNAILGFSEAMREQIFGPLGNDRYRDYAAHIHSSGQHLLTLTVELLQLSQGEAGKLELNEIVVDLAAITRNCLDVMTPAAQEAELTLKNLVPTGLPLIRADETKIRQMLFYLVDNAIRFTPPHGEASIEASAAANGGIDLVVRDTGIGMKAEDIPLALQPFGRIASPLKHENEGMGLGLPISKRLAELHGAELAISSKPGKGTACTISFPASRCVAAAKTDRSAAVAA
jgi:signal transduction histidine kinase